MKKIIVSLKNKSTTNNGVFQGWGSSLCWWAHRIGYSPVLTKKSAEIFYSDNGLNLNIMRYNIGGGDDPTHKHITRTDSEVPGWLYFDNNSNTYSYKYDADSNQLNVLKECYKASGDDAYVEVFSNSPPYFMTKSGCSSGGKNPTRDNLREDSYEAFAEYLAHVTEYINNKLKIKVSSISPMNEPASSYWHYLSDKQEGCHFSSGKSQNKIIFETAKAIRAKGLKDVEIVASDETSTSHQITSYNKYTDEVKEVIDRISTHTYITRRSKQLGQLAKEKGFNLWMSETDWSNTLGKSSGEMGAGLWLASKIITDINDLSPSAWVIWLVIDFHISKNGFNCNKDFGMPDMSKGFWGVAVADHDNKEIILSQKYYAFGQFSRYIRPGDSIIHCDKNTLASFNNASKKLTIVTFNSSEMDIEKDIILDGFDIEFSEYKTIRTSGSLKDGEHWKDLGKTSLENNTFKTKIKGYSVTTYVIE